ncbi:MAG TPA: CHAD domain-containing protein [Bryobacteraceae bacterium]|nr:CHAD domain-containing protein [Bryobacteraceae bacterium]
MKWKPSETAASNACRVLPKLAEQYFKSGRTAADGKRSAKALHQFRVTTKKFRYALELFRPVYGKSLERRLKALRDLQDILGKISDHQTILDVLPKDKQLGAKVERALKRKSKEFRKAWETFDADGELKQWKSFLNRTRRRASVRQKQKPPP